MLMAVEIAISSPFEGWENVDSHISELGAVAGLSDMMLEVELRTSTATQSALLSWTS